MAAHTVLQNLLSATVTHQPADFNRFLLPCLVFGISDFGTEIRRRVRSVIRSSGVLGFGFGVILVSSGPEAGVCG